MTLLPFLLLACADPIEPVASDEAPVAAVPVASTEPAPGPSLFALDLPMLLHSGETARIDVQRGHPTLLSMYYTTCPMACPLLIEDIEGLRAGLGPEARAALRVVLVSLDPVRDDAAAMRGVVEKHGLDGAWTLGAVPEASVRDVAAALGVRYRPLADGGFAHTAVLTLVDGEGRIVARSEGEEGRAELVAAIGRLATAGPSSYAPRASE